MFLMGETFGNYGAVPATSPASCVLGHYTFVGPIVIKWAVGSSKIAGDRSTASLAQLVGGTKP